MRSGATNVNGTTSWDRTGYFETVPRQHLELVLWIESDRMGFLSEAFTPERFEVQRDVVKNERRQTYENAPYGPSELALYQTLFAERHPYRGAVIGSMADLDAATVADVVAFYDAYYAPSNATLAVAGDFDRAEVVSLIEKYFGSLRTRARPARARLTTQPLAGQRRVVVDEPVELARVTFGWITPPAFTPDDTALDLVSLVLAGGKATRLYRRLVVEEQVAVDVAASIDSAELAGIFTVTATAASGKPLAEVERAIDRVLGELGEQGPDPAELERARRRLLVEVFQTAATPERTRRRVRSCRAPPTLQSLPRRPRFPRPVPRACRAALSRGPCAGGPTLLGPGARAVVVTRPKPQAGGGQP